MVKIPLTHTEMDKKQKEEKIRLRLNNLFKMICNVWDKTPRENQNVLWNVIDIKRQCDTWEVKTG